MSTPITCGICGYFCNNYHHHNNWVWDYERPLVPPVSGDAGPKPVEAPVQSLQQGEADADLLGHDALNEAMSATYDGCTVEVCHNAHDGECEHFEAGWKECAAIATRRNAAQQQRIKELEEENAKLRKALEGIKKHQEMSRAGTGTDILPKPYDKGMAWYLADRALLSTQPTPPTTTEP